MGQVHSAQNELTIELVPTRCLVLGSLYGTLESTQARSSGEQRSVAGGLLRMPLQVDVEECPLDLANEVLDGLGEGKIPSGAVVLPPK